jgi:hypothetical protein
MDINNQNINQNINEPIQDINQLPCVTAIPISQEDIESQSFGTNILEIYSRSKTIMFLSFFHCFINVVNSLKKWIFIIFSLFCLLGYKGAKDFNPSLTTYYLVYVLMDFCGQTVYLYDINKADVIEKDNRGFVYILETLTILIHLWIIAIVCKFISNLKQLSNENINLLRGGENMNYNRYVLI